jgi:hypothetical protein
MLFGLFILAVALSISAVAAYYSIAGLTAIFAAAVVPIIIMGAVLEVGKIAATVWLHKFWHRANIQFKLYLVPAILVLMLITSMGIFGFLSKAHMDQNITVGDSAAQVQILDEKIKTEQDNISVNKRALQQMDAQVDQMLGRTTDDRGANRAVQIRKNQARERKSLQADITAAQKNISALQAERAPLAAQNRKIEAEVGPIKYIAALIYGDNPNADLLERAVRWVIILLVFVFDPLALILILAAEQTLMWAREDKRKKEDEYELDDGPLTDEEISTITATADVEDVEMTEKLFDTEEEFFAHGKEIARELDAQEDRLPDNYASTQAYLHTPWVWPERTTNEGLVPKQPIVEDPLDIPIPEGEEMWAQEAIDTDTSKQDLDNAISLIAEMQSKLDVLQAEHDAKHEELAQIKSVDPVTLTDHLGNPIATYYPPVQQQVVVPDLSINAELDGNSVSAGFGTTFPKNPTKGDLYLRVDYLPSKLYKWNDIKWIEVDKTTTDVYSYDVEYIKHLTNKIASGEYDVDLLTPAEQEQIQQYIKNNPQ